MTGINPLKQQSLALEAKPSVRDKLLYPRRRKLHQWRVMLWFSILHSSYFSVLNICIYDEIWLLDHRNVQNLWLSLRASWKGRFICFMQVALQATCKVTACFTYFILTCELYLGWNAWTHTQQSKLMQRQLLSSGVNGLCYIFMAFFEIACVSSFSLI